LTERFPELAPWFRAAEAPPVRRASECPFRRDVRGRGPEETARCDLLGHWIGDVLPDAPRDVRREACDACCAAPPPPPTELNPVIASLLVTLCDRALKGGAALGRDVREKVAALQARAVESLEVSWDDPIQPLPVRGPGSCVHFGAPIGFRSVATPHGG